MTIVTAGTSSYLTRYNSSIECDDEPYAHRLNSSQHDRGAVWRRTTNGNHSVLRGYVWARRRLPRGCLVPRVVPDVSRWRGTRPAVRRPRRNPRRRVGDPSRRLLTGARVPARLRQGLRNRFPRRPRPGGVSDGCHGDRAKDSTQSPRFPDEFAGNATTKCHLDEAKAKYRPLPPRLLVVLLRVSRRPILPAIPAPSSRSARHLAALTPLVGLDPGRIH